MIISPDYIRIEEQNIRNVALKSCSIAKDKAEQSRMPYNCCCTAKPSNCGFASDYEVAYGCYTARKSVVLEATKVKDVSTFINSPFKEFTNYNSAWIEMGVGA